MHIIHFNNWTILSRGFIFIVRAYKTFPSIPFKFCRLQLDWMFTSYFWFLTAWCLMFDMFTCFYYLPFHMHAILIERRKKKHQNNNNNRKTRREKNARDANVRLVIGVSRNEAYIKLVRMTETYAIRNWKKKHVNK